MNLLLRIFSIAFALLCANCAGSNPATRSQRRVAAFQALPTQHQQLALQGKIKEGMNRDAVWVAWGPAGRIYEAAGDGKTWEIWRYTGLQPVYGHSLSLGMGYGYGRYRHGYAEPFSFYDYHYGPQYVPYTHAEVKFQKGLVKSWQRMRE